jgi:hypothetical protein
MRLTWDGYPVHYDANFGWGFLVPAVEDKCELEEELRRQDPEGEKAESKFPVR